VSAAALRRQRNSSRAELLAALGLDVRVTTWTAVHDVDADWVVGHLGSALSAGALERGGLDTALRAWPAAGGPFAEEVVTTAVSGRLGG